MFACCECLLNPVTFESELVAEPDQRGARAAPREALAVQQVGGGVGAVVAGDVDDETRQRVAREMDAELLPVGVPFRRE